MHQQQQAPPPAAPAADMAPKATQLPAEQLLKCRHSSLRAQQVQWAPAQAQPHCQHSPVPQGEAQWSWGVLQDSCMLQDKLCWDRREKQQVAVWQPAGGYL